MRLKMVNEAEARLFMSLRCDNRHVLKKHLPPLKVHKYSLRMRPHNMTLPPKDDRNFIARHLFTVKPASTRSLRVRAHNFILPLKDKRNFVRRVLYEAICPPPDYA